MEAVCVERTGSRLDAFYRTMDLTNPIKAFQADQAETEQAEQANVPAERWSEHFLRPSAS